MTQTLLNEEWVCVFCNAEFDNRPMFCGECNEYKGIMNSDDAIITYPEIFAWKV